MAGIRWDLWSSTLLTTCPNRPPRMRGVCASLALEVTRPPVGSGLVDSLALYLGMPLLGRQCLPGKLK
jgi:hypothetical protein